MRVYIAAPFSSSNVIEMLKNIGRAEQMAAKLFELGYDPFCPHYDKDFIIKNPESKHHLSRFYEYCLKWLEVSDVMLVIGMSEGVREEIKFCKDSGIPVAYSIEELRSMAV